jgi:hypothetical protein
MTALELADYLDGLESIEDLYLRHAWAAAAELRRLAEIERQKENLIKAMQKIAVASGAAYTNQEWVKAHAYAAIDAAMGEAK